MGALTNVTQGNVRIGRPDTHPAVAAHTRGGRQGNATGNYRDQPGHTADGRSTARRSTGINPGIHDPIDPRSPNLSPA
jgi:hypothetical protein